MPRTRPHRIERHPKTVPQATIRFTVSDLGATVAFCSAVNAIIGRIERGELTDVRRVGELLDAAWNRYDRATVQRGAPINRKPRPARDAPGKGHRGAGP